jgi:Tol biopolymer transport system component
VPVFRRFVVSLVVGVLAVLGLPVVSGLGVGGAGAAVPPAGYWMLDAQGRIYRFGDAAQYGPAGSNITAVDIEAKSDGSGVWVVDDAGTVYGFGSSQVLGAKPTLNAGEKIVTMSRTASGVGYWLTSSTGRTFNYGDAAKLGNITDFTPGNVPLNQPIIDSAPTVDGRAVYMVAQDGGVFAMGGAPFFGSTANLKLNSPVRSIVPDPDGAGYWLIAGDGGVFSYNADFKQSTANLKLNKPIVGMVAYGDAYLQVAADGGIFNFAKNLDFFGSLGGQTLPAPIVSVAAFGSTVVLPTPTITTTSLPGGSQGAAYSATLAASSGTSPYTWAVSAGALPAGLSLSPAGAITGTPTAPGTSAFTVRVTDAAAKTATKDLSILVTGASATLAISTTSLPGASQGIPYTAPLTATGATGAVTWSATGLPTGLAISASTGAITGRAGCLAGASASVTVTATDSSGTANRTLPLTVAALGYEAEAGWLDHLARVTNEPIGVAYLSRATLSGNGCIVAFESKALFGNGAALFGGATDLNNADGDPNNNTDIFVFDRGLGVVRRVTNGNDMSEYPSLSADGRYLAFSSRAINLQSTFAGVFLVDLQANTITRAAPSRASDSSLAGSQVQISANGNRVVYSAAGPTAPGFLTQIYLWDRTTGLTVQVSHSPYATTVAAPYWDDANGDSENPSLNLDGTVVTFASRATNLISAVDAAADTNTAPDVFVWTATTATPSGFLATPAAGTSRSPVLVADAPTATGTMRRVTNGNAASNWPYISADGSRVAFVSYAFGTSLDGTTLGPDVDATPANYDGAFSGTCGPRQCFSVFEGDADVFTAARPGASWSGGGTVTRITNGASGSFLVGLNTDGSILVFDSHDATPAATTGGEVTSSLTVFWKAAAAPVPFMPYNTADVTNSEQKVRPAVSGDGRYIVFASADSNPLTTGTTGETDNNSGNGAATERYDFYVFGRSAT